MRADNQNIIELIDQVRNSLVKRKFLFSALTAVLLGALFLTIIGYVIPKAGLREDQFFGIFLALLIIPAAGIVYSLVKFFSSRISRQEIAVKVEDARPELMDAYACAVDIAEKGGPQGPIEEALTRQVKDRFKTGEIGKIIIPGHLSSSIISTLLVVVLLLSWAALGTPLAKTAFLHVKAQGNPVLAGVEVTPGDVKLPHGKDLRIETLIKRGREEAKVEYNMGGKWTEVEMYNEGEGRFSAIIYGVDSNFQYRVVTPDVSSDNFTVTVYLEPEIEDFKVTVTPPEYMKRPVVTSTEFKDLVVPENSVVEFEITSNKECRVALVEDKTEIPFSSGVSTNHKYSFKAEKTHIYSFNLKDEEGYSSASKPFKISIVKDMPPHVEVTKPAKDVKKYKHDVVQLEVNALDDFGLDNVKLHLEFSTDVNGKFIYDSRTITVLKSDAEKVLEKTLFYDLNLKDEAAKEGDIISYYFSATDNKQPIPQSSRSKIYFIEVRPDKSDVQDNEEEQEGDQQEQQITVNDLIALQKDLIRKVIDAGRTSKKLEDGKYEVDAEIRQQLSSDTATLKLEVQKRYDKLKEEADKMQASLGVIGDYFLESVKSLKEAELALNTDQLDDGMRLHNQSLHNLIKIAIELEKNTQKQKSKSKNQQQQEQQQQEEQENEDERLADMLEKLEELEEKQEDLNKELRKENKEELAQQELQKQMQEQQKAMEEMAEQLEEMKQQQAAQQMQQASQQQQQANQQQQQGNSQGAQQQSQQAQQSLENASNEIKRAMRDKARQKLQQLARQLDKTIEKQNEINEKTSGVEDPKSEKGKSELADLKKKQDEVQKEIDNVMDQLGAAANELDEKYPEVAEALRESREFASNQGIQRRLKRSSNALHYKRKDAAEREQEKASEAMNMLGHKVRDAIGRLPQATLDELLKMRQDLEMARREIANSQGQQGGQQAANMSQQLSQMMQDMGERLKNDDLQNGIPQFLEDSAKSGDAGVIGTSQMKAVNQAAFILEALINQADLEKRLSLNRRTGAPPDKYRRSVREYLKSLSVQEK